MFGYFAQVNFHLYHYAGNNPVKYVDPDGNAVHVVIGAGIGALVEGLSSAITGGSLKDIAAAAVGGAVTGGMAAATCGMSLGASIAGSAMAGTAGYLAESMVAGKQATVEGAIGAGLSGAAGAMAGTVVDKAVNVAVSKVSQATKSVKTNLSTNDSCFVEGTLISTENGFIPIERINIGDNVYSYNEELSTVEINKVINTFIHLETELIILKINETEIITTKTHPFWTKEKGWLFADELEVGYNLLSKNGENYSLKSIYNKILSEPIRVYNIEVENAHTYFVNDIEILVHNKAAKIMHFGKYSVSNSEFHGENGIKKQILNDVKGYKKQVGANPNISVLDDGTVKLEGVGDFKGKSIKTDLNFEDYLGY